MVSSSPVDVATSFPTPKASHALLTPTQWATNESHVQTAKHVTKESRQGHSPCSGALLSVTVQGDPLFTLTLSATNDNHVKAAKHATKESKRQNSPCSGPLL